MRPSTMSSCRLPAAPSTRTRDGKRRSGDRRAGAARAARRAAASDYRRQPPGDRGNRIAAFPGTKADGRDFIGDALARGADAVLWEPHAFKWNPEWHRAQLAVEGLKAKLGMIADFIYGSPSQALWVVGVTGTNGKTSCSRWIAQCLDRCGKRAAIVGTLGNGLVGAEEAATLTTPDAALLQEMLARYRKAGALAVAMEVSSH